VPRPWDCCGYLRLCHDGTVAGEHKHYGDGVFRTLLINNGKPANWPRHLRRLLEDARRIGLSQPDPSNLTQRVGVFVQGAESAILKIILTRGPAERGYHSVGSTPSCILLLYPSPEAMHLPEKDGIRVCICETRLSRNPRLAGIKHLNRLEQVLARAEWADPSIGEGLMLDTADNLVEGVSSNLFLVKSGALLTANLSFCGVEGVTREMILEIALQHSMAVNIRDLSLEDLYQADECFICNSVTGIRPVTQLNDKFWPVGTLTRRLQTHFGDICPEKD
jgi:4-amino-4-deoxychorismate lyase